MGETTVKPAGATVCAKREDSLRLKRPSVSRPLTLLDGMILVAATGVGFHFCRASVNQELVDTKSWTAINLVSFLVASWTVSLLAIRLIPPRPGLRRLMRQPGVVACLIVTVVIAVKAVYCGLIRAVVSLEAMTSGGYPYLRGDWFDTLAMHSGSIGAAVCVAWLMLLLSGRRLPERSWIDRLGRILGAYWIILILITSWFNAREIAGVTVPNHSLPIPSNAPPAPGVLSGPLPPQPPAAIDLLDQSAAEQFSVARGRSFAIPPSAPPEASSAAVAGTAGGTPANASQGSSASDSP